MKPLPHHYDVHLSGGPAGYAELSSLGLQALRTAPPASYDGPGDAWSPEHLLLASVQACFLFTLRAIARVSKVEFAGLELDAAGTVARVDGVTRFTEIVLRSTLRVPAGANRERMVQMLERAKKTCLVTASLATAVKLETDVQEV
jgi:organic hydroperoxide reductase OsmC/OhrA